MIHKANYLHQGRLRSLHLEAACGFAANEHKSWHAYHIITTNNWHLTNPLKLHIRTYLLKIGFRNFMNVSSRAHIDVSDEEEKVPGIYIPRGLVEGCKVKVVQSYMGRYGVSLI
jgi:hypothetical protein